MFASDTFTLEPGMRNSNLLPVNANGLVRLRSVVSRSKLGSTSTPKSSCSRSVCAAFSPLANASMIEESSSPKKMEIIAGGASCAPRRWSFPQLATLMRSKS